MPRTIDNIWEMLLCLFIGWQIIYKELPQHFTIHYMISSPIMSLLDYLQAFQEVQQSCHNIVYSLGYKLYLYKNHKILSQAALYIINQWTYYDHFCIIYYMCQYTALCNISWLMFKNQPLLMAPWFNQKINQFEPYIVCIALVLCLMVTLSC